MPYITEYVYRPAPKPLQHRLRTWLLLALSGLAIIALLWPFLPQVTYTLHASWPSHRTTVAQAQEVAKATQAPGPGNWLLIPAIGVKTQVAEGKDVGVLDRTEGVWHQVGQPGKSNIVLAGHRFKYLPPNQTTFYNLDKLSTGDSIVLWWRGQRYSYTVQKQFTVKRTATEILNPTDAPQLTLYTCTDLAASKRLVVIATP